MSMRLCRASIPISALVLLALQVRPALAAWPTDPTVNVPLCTATGAQSYPDAARDASGGIIVAWDDQRSGPRDIYARRVDGNGTPRWTVDGVAVCTATGEQYEPKLVPDGSGGAIIAWTDWRGTAYDIYAQRVDSTGTTKWTANGVAICSAADFQADPELVADGSGGAIITWSDPRNGIDRIYAQKVNANGAPQWTANGLLLTTSVSGQARPVIVSDGAGGAIVGWEDYRNGEVDIFAQHVLANGGIDPAWPPAGRAVALSWGDQDAPVLAVDGSGGAIVSWAQWNGGTRDIVAKHLLASGVIDPAWPSAGRFLNSDFYDQAAPAIVADGAGGAVISWDDYRGPDRDIYAQHVLSSGAIDSTWTVGGTSLCLEAGDQVNPRMTADGAGGAVVTWEDHRADAGDIHAQHVLATGAVDAAWPTGGRALCTAALLQVRPAIVSDGAGGAVVAWEDRRSNAGPSGEDGDIYAQRVLSNGQLGDVPIGVSDGPQLDFALESPSPNPTRSGALLMRFTLPNSAAASLELFDVAGRRIAGREVGSLGAGHHTVDLAAGQKLRAGMYFVRLLNVRVARVRRVVVIEG